MSQQSRLHLKQRFETGDFPSQQDFIDLFDSFHHKTEDTYPGSDGDMTKAEYATNERTGEVDTANTVILRDPEDSDPATSVRGILGTDGTDVELSATRNLGIVAQAILQEIASYSAAQFEPYRLRLIVGLSRLLVGSTDNDNAEQIAEIRSGNGPDAPGLRVTADLHSEVFGALRLLSGRSSEIAEPDGIVQGDRIPTVDPTTGQVVYKLMTALGGADALADLGDVDLTGLADGVMLRYNSSASAWEIITTGEANIQSPTDDALITALTGASYVNNSATVGAAANNAGREYFDGQYKYEIRDNAGLVWRIGGAAPGGGSGTFALVDIGTPSVSASSTDSDPEALEEIDMTVYGDLTATTSSAGGMWSKDISAAEDFDISVKIVALDQGAGRSDRGGDTTGEQQVSGKIGIAIRDDHTAGARMVWAAWGDLGSVCRYRGVTRLTTDAAASEVVPSPDYTSYLTGGASGADRYVRLTRTGSDVAMFLSNDGASWTQIGATVSFGNGAAKVGIQADAEGNGANAVTYYFEDLTVA